MVGFLWTSDGQIRGEKAKFPFSNLNLLCMILMFLLLIDLTRICFSFLLFIIIIIMITIIIIIICLHWNHHRPWDVRVTSGHITIFSLNTKAQDGQAAAAFSH